MGLLLAYSLKSAILLSVLFSVYLIFVRPSASPSVRRACLLAIYCLAAFLPLLNFDATPLIQDEINFAVSDHDSDLANEYLIPSVSENYVVMAWILICGIVLLLLRMIATCVYLFSLFIKGTKEIKGEVVITVLPGKNFSPFCFAKRIFVSEKEYDRLSDMVLCHEKSHIYRMHFLDLIFSRIITTIQWWNPIAWGMLRDLKDVHEFEADDDVIAAGYSRRDYQYLLLERTTGNKVLNLGHGFRNSRLRARLKMMNNSFPTGSRIYRLLMLVPAAVAGVLLISSPVVSPFLLNASRVSLPDQVNDSITEAADSGLPWEPTEAIPYPYLSDKVAVRVNGKLATKSELNAIDPDLIESINVIKSMPQFPDGLIDIHLKSLITPRKEKKSNEAIIGWDRRLYNKNAYRATADTLDGVVVVAVGSFKK